MYIYINIHVYIYLSTYIYDIRMNIQVPYRASCRSAPWQVYIRIHNITVIYTYAYYIYQHRLANASQSTQHTLVDRDLAVVEPVAHASFQRGHALEALRGADIVHEHKLLIAAAAPVIGPLLCCSVLNRAV